MKVIFAIIIAMTLFATACSKKPLTLDENTSMRTLLRASDKEIIELVIREVEEKLDLSAEDVSVEYILRDRDSQALAVKIRIIQ